MNNIGQAEKKNLSNLTPSASVYFNIQGSESKAFSHWNPVCILLILKHMGFFTQTCLWSSVDMINNNFSLFFCSWSKFLWMVDVVSQSRFFLYVPYLYIYHSRFKTGTRTIAGLCEHAFSLSCKHIKKCYRVFTACFVTDRKAVIVENFDVQACRVVRSGIIE